MAVACGTPPVQNTFIHFDIFSCCTATRERSRSAPPELMVERGAIGSNDFTLVAAPLQLEGMDGAPARVFDIVE